MFLVQAGAQATVGAVSHSDGKESKEDLYVAASSLAALSSDQEASDKIYASSVPGTTSAFFTC